MEPIWIWSALIAALSILILALYLWRRSRGFAGRLGRLAGRVGRLKRVRPGAESYELLRQVYALAHAAVAARDEAGAYRAIDLAKTVYGHGVARPDEAELLAALARAAALDACRILLKRLPPEAQPAAVDQAAGIAAVALREKYNFLAAKAAEIIFGLLERTDWRQDEAIAAAGLRALGTVGALTLRRRDGDLFREIITRLAALAPARATGAPAAELAGLTAAWLHRIVQSGDAAMFALLADFTASKGAGGLWPAPELAALVKEWHHLAGTASLRPGSVLGPAVAETALRLALAGGDAKGWEASVAAGGQTARMAIQRHGLAGGFPLVLPLLEVGRELLALELKFGSADSDPFRQRALYLLVRECLAVAEFAARQDMVSTAGDVITGLHDHWTAAGRANPKAAKRFCQLLAAFWLHAGSRKARRAPVSEALATPPLLTDNDMRRLGFLS